MDFFLNIFLLLHIYVNNIMNYYRDTQSIAELDLHVYNNIVILFDHYINLEKTIFVAEL